MAVGPGEYRESVLALYVAHGRQDTAQTAFLADSNAIVIKTDDLVEIIAFLKEAFPSVQRITSYARAKTVLAKSMDDLRRLREVGLSRLNMGLESGDEEVHAAIQAHRAIGRAELEAFARKELRDFPRVHYHLLERLPRNAMGKVVRSELRTMLLPRSVAGKQ